jgi:hypothetical protein
MAAGALATSVEEAVEAAGVEKASGAQEIDPPLAGRESEQLVYQACFGLGFSGHGRILLKRRLSNLYSMHP